MSLASLRADLEGMASATERMHRTSQDLVREMKSGRQADAIKALESGLAASLWSIWQQIAGTNANDPSLPRLEIEMRRFGGVDISFLSGLRRALAKAQQKKRAAAGSRSGGKYDSALSADEFGSILGEYSGGNP